MAKTFDRSQRPNWPHRAIVTAGEPYGNKGLHFGHVGGVFVPQTSTRASCATCWAART